MCLGVKILPASCLNADEKSKEGRGQEEKRGGCGNKVGSRFIFVGSRMNFLPSFCRIFPRFSAESRDFLANLGLKIPFWPKNTLFSTEKPHFHGSPFSRIPEQEAVARNPTQFWRLDNSPNIHTIVSFCKYAYSTPLDIPCCCTASPLLLPYRYKKTIAVR